MLTASVVAFALGVATEQLLDGGPIVASVATAAVVASLFAVRPIDGLPAFLVVVLLADTVEVWSGVDLRYLDEATLPMLGLALVTTQRSRLSIVRPRLREAMLAVFLITAVLSSVVNAVPLNVWLPALGLLGKGFAFFYLVAMLRITSGELHRIASVLFAVALTIGGLGIAQFVGGDLVRDLPLFPPYDQERAGIPLVNSLFRHPALYGWITVFTGLFLFARFVVLREWWALGLAVLLTAASPLSGRRTPILGMFVGLITLFARQASVGRRALRTMVPIAVLLVLLVVVSLPVLGRFYDMTLAEYAEPPELVEEIFADDPDPSELKAMAPRNALYLGSLAITRDHLPFGVGLGRFASHMSRETYSPVYETYGLHRIHGLSERHPIAITDTFWPMIAGETGAIGLLAALAWFALTARDLWRASSRSTPPHVRAFTLGALLVFAEALVRSLTSAVFVAPPIAYFALGTAGLVLAIARTTTPHGSVSPAAVPPLAPR